jgi:polygalacturonase
MLLFLRTVAATVLAPTPHPTYALQITNTSSNKLCPITSYGGSISAKDNSAAIQKALVDCSSGGTVVVAGGNYKTGPVVVTGSGLTLEVQAGAILSTAFGPDNW